MVFLLAVEEIVAFSSLRKRDFVLRNWPRRTLQFGGVYDFLGRPQGTYIPVRQTYHVIDWFRVRCSPMQEHPLRFFFSVAYYVGWSSSKNDAFRYLFLVALLPFYHTYGTEKRYLAPPCSFVFWQAKPLVLLSLLRNAGRQQELSVVFTSSVDSTHRLFRLLQLYGGAMPFVYIFYPSF